LTQPNLHVLLIGLDAALSEELAHEDGFTLEHVEGLAGVSDAPVTDAVVLVLEGEAPLEALGILRAYAPDAAVLVVTGPDRDTDGTVALHAGAEDHLVLGAIPPGLLSRAVRYAVAQRRLHRELATQDEATGLPNLRGFAAIAEHHLRMADRARTPVVFLFVRIDGFAELAASLGPEPTDELARDAAEVLLEAVRDSDLPARIAPDTFCVLLTGEARGAEALVLSRLVEAIALNDARRHQPRQLSLSVGSALYDPEQPATLEQLLNTAGQRLTNQSSDP
jgi:diguanylate cyclase (GGDEF)-like protein